MFFLFFFLDFLISFFFCASKMRSRKCVYQDVDRKNAYFDQFFHSQALFGCRFMFFCCHNIVFLCDYVTTLYDFITRNRSIIPRLLRNMQKKNMSNISSKQGERLARIFYSLLNDS